MPYRQTRLMFWGRFRIASIGFSSGNGCESVAWRQRGCWRRDSEMEPLRELNSILKASSAGSLHRFETHPVRQSTTAVSAARQRSMLASAPEALAYPLALSAYQARFTFSKISLALAVHK